jgi:serine protease inhibitor
MMQHTTHHAYGELQGTQVLELTYIRGELAMRLAVPADEKGLARVESLANELLALPLRQARVHLSMPRFRCESRFTLEGPLSKMGLASVFRYGHADLSGSRHALQRRVSTGAHDRGAHRSESSRARRRVSEAPARRVA